MKMTKKEAAAQARAAGEKRFMWACEQHGETAHYSNAREACVECCAERNRLGHARRMATPGGPEARNKKQRERRSNPEVRDAVNAYHRDYERSRKANDPSFLGAAREHVIAHQWRKMTGAKAMPAGYAAEQSAIRRVYAECPEGHHVDHLIPRVAKDIGGNLVAVGLHSLANIRAVPQRLNLKKASFFDPDNFRDQRPANAFPGGAWDPELTEQEWSQVALVVLRYGEDRETAVRTIQAQIARQHQAALSERI
ncbi:hypothetical protein P9250_19705 [Caballeronia sp. LP006]|uniref:hypothetical protein n=1 Tax=Caballeronia sp. LP006 TaxID=3038552 RepID=UPI002858C1EC|nr:hypothetical protein [Caballeronia sp. LP006]MDR5830102.1 hypothetical protein [Caballeronia sp. LP006]